MDLTFVKEFMQNSPKKFCYLIADGTINLTCPEWLCVSHLKTEDDHLAVLRLLLNEGYSIHNEHITSYYVRMDYMVCLKLFAPKLLLPTLYIAMYGLHYCNIHALQLAETFRRHYDLTSCYFSSSMPHDAFRVWQDIVYGTVGFGDFKKVLGYSEDCMTGLRQHKLLIQISLKHKHVYTLPLIKSIMTNDDHHKLWLLKEFCRMINLQDVYAGCILFLFVQC